MALALLVLWSQASTLVVGFALPGCAFAQSQDNTKAISSASAASKAFASDASAGAAASGHDAQGNSLTRISRPHPLRPNNNKDFNGPGAPGSEIKLMPLQPLTDPVETPIHSINIQSGQMQAPGSEAIDQRRPPAGPAPLGPEGEDPYPTIGKLEALTLGAPQPTVPITDRLARLENSVFKRVYVDESLFDRTDRLKKTLLGPDYLDPNSAAARDRLDFLGMPGSLGLSPGSSLGPDLGMGLLDISPGADSASAVHYLDEMAARPENREAAKPEALAQAALDLINYERRNAGVAPLSLDNVAETVAAAHVQELARRSSISHFSLQGDNPDRRYTLAGGNDAMVESIASVKCNDAGGKKLSKAALARSVKALLSRQDDRDALMSPDATQFGFSMALSADNSKLLSAFEIVSRHGVIDSVPVEVGVGDKLEIKGVIESPYVFDRVTVAWEAYNGGGSSSNADESEDALPYFPPLDYVAYAKGSEHDYGKAIFALKTAGVVAAIAGGMFIPPVALAAPLIMMSGGGGSEPRPVSDIPIKGGVKVDGGSFDVKIPISNNNKEGLYYITVYGSLGSHAQQSVALSRRVVLARALPKGESGHTLNSAIKPVTKAKHKANRNSTGQVSAQYDEKVSGQAEVKSGAGTAGGDGLQTSASAGNNIKGSDKPVIYSPESNQEGKTDAATQP